MNIVLFFTYDVSLSDWVRTGLFQREIRPYKILMRDHDVSFTFLTYGDEEDRRHAHHLPGINIIPVFETIPRPNSKTLRFLTTLIIPLIFRASLKDATIYKTNQLWGSWLAAISSLIWRKPLLIRCGYEPNKNNMHAGVLGFRERITYLLSSFAYRRATHMIATTPEIIDFITERFSLDEKKITVVSNWIDSSLFLPPHPDTPRTLDSILFVGRLSREKNIPLLVEALSGTNLGLTIVGQGPERDLIVKRAAENCVNVNFLSSTANELMPKHYQRHAIFVLCSEFEGNPKTLLEAMACGCAVIGTDSPGIKSLIENRHTGLIVRSTPSDLLNAIDYLLSNPTERVRLGTAARDFVVKNNSLQDAVTIEWSIYRKICDSSSSVLR